MSYSLYIHIPFCRRRCGYCDFNTYAGREELLEVYVAALCREVQWAAQAAGQRLPVGTVYFGGGTPSLLNPAQVTAVLQAIAAGFDLDCGAEVTLEANPGTLSQAGLAGLRSAGVNRLSLGMQAADAQDLRILGRQHETGQVLAGVRMARRAGFSSLSLDLIYGIPGQTLERWQAGLELALGMGVEHLSLYALTVEDETPLAHWLRRGLLLSPDDDLAADMAEWARNRLAEAGFEHYEVSNWALGPQFRSRHNLQYWHNAPYLGLGAGAHGWAAGYRTVNELTIEAYLARMGQTQAGEFPFGPANVVRQLVGRQTEMQETMMVGLRLIQDGVSERGFEQRFGVPLMMAFGEPIERLTRQGLLEWAGAIEDRHLRLTPRAWLIANRVFAEFVA